jgi:voltage-gated potassium channel
MDASDRTSQDRLRRWEHLGNWPLALAAIAFLAAYAWPIIRPNLNPGWRDICLVVVNVVWAVFIVDYVVRLALAHDRWRYVWRHLPDLIVLALPFLRPLRLVILLKVLHRRAADTLRGRIAIYVVGATILLVFCASLAVLDAERGHHGANLTSLGDALWWSPTTVTTVGYGDHFPVTGTGRAVAVGLMIGGVALLGVVTATLASWLIDRVREAEEQAEAATRADVATLTAEVRELKAMIAAGAARTASDPA